jgi:hypothetical protein
MTWFLVFVADLWRQRWRFGLPIILGALAAVIYTLNTAPIYEAKSLLQVQSDQARAPLLRSLTAPGQENALKQFLTNQQLLADTSKDMRRAIDASHVGLKVVNDHLISISYRSKQREGLEQATDTLSYNFILAVLAPERMRIEQLILQNQHELQELAGRLATSDGRDATAREQLLARQGKVQTDTAKRPT